MEDYNNNEQNQEQKQEPEYINPIIVVGNMEKSYVEDYFKRKADEERIKRENEVSEHLKDLLGFEEKEPEKIDTDELINKMHAVTKKELESLIKG